MGTVTTGTTTVGTMGTIGVGGGVITTTGVSTTTTGVTTGVSVIGGGGADVRAFRPVTAPRVVTPLVTRTPVRGAVVVAVKEEDEGVLMMRSIAVMSMSLSLRSERSDFLLSRQRTLETVE